jgi:hypothetical protein
MSDYIRDVIDYLGLKEVKRVKPSLMPEMPSMELATLHPSFMPDCSRGGAPPQLWADFCEFNSDLCNLLSAEVYSQ